MRALFQCVRHGIMEMDDLASYCPFCGNVVAKSTISTHENAHGRDDPAAGRTHQQIRRFETGASRDVDEHKIDPEACLSPIVLEAFAQYMVICQIMPDGTRRADDNWQKGMPCESYIKSGWRHWLEFWKWHRARTLFPELSPVSWIKVLQGQGPKTTQLDLDVARGILLGGFGLLFNVQGYLHEYIKRNPDFVTKVLAEFETTRKNANQK